MVIQGKSGSKSPIGTTLPSFNIQRIKNPFEGIKKAYLVTETSKPQYYGAWSRGRTGTATRTEGF